MADRIKGITVEIGGDTTKLYDALKDVNKETKKTQDQLKDVERLLKLDPKNTELLAQKQTLLTKAIGETKDRLDILKTAEDQMRSKGVDENSEQFQGLRREIISTESELQSLQKRAEPAAEAIEESGEEAEKAGEKHKSLSGALKTAGAAFAAVGTAAVAATVKIAKGLADATKEGAAYADTVLTESTVTGIATDKLQEYMYAEELLDVSTGTLTKSMAKNVKSMDAARDGSAAMADAYAALGVQVADADGNLRDSEEVYWEVIDALGNVENETERDALGMQILGKSAQELNPLIQAGTETIAQLGEEARATGYVLSDETLASYGAYDDQLQRLEKGAQAAKNAVGTILLPALTDLAEEGVAELTKFSNGIAEAEGDVDKINETIAGVLTDILQKAQDALPNILGLLEKILASVVAHLPAILQTLVPGLVSLLIVVAEALIDNIDVLLDAVGQIMLAVSLGVIQALPTLIEKLPVIVEKVIDFIFENIPFIAGQLVAAVFLSLPAIISGVVKATKQLLGQVWRVIEEAMTGGGSIIENLITGIVQAFSKGGAVFQQLGDSFKTILKSWINALIKGINTVIAKPLETINGLFDKLRNISFLGISPFKNLDWKIPVPQIPMLASGGILSSGSAIVGEAGPELLTMQGGRAVVQPLTATVDSAGLAEAMRGATTPVNVYVGFDGDLAGLGRVLTPHIEAAQRIGGLSLVK